MRALRNLTETKLEKNLVNASHESLERVYQDMATMGVRLRELSQSAKAAEIMQPGTSASTGAQIGNDTANEPQTQFSE